MENQALTSQAHDLQTGQGMAVPRSNEAEKVVLSCLMQDPKSAYAAVQRAVAQWDIFYDTKHQALFSAIELTLDDFDQCLELPNLLATLSNTQSWDEAGSGGYAAQIWNYSPTPALLQDHLNLCIDVAKRRNLIRTLGNAIRQAYNLQIDFDTALETTEKVLTKSVRGTEDSQWRSSRQVGEGTINRIDQRFQNKGQLPGLSSGFPGLDNLTNGWCPGQLVIAAARPSVGKTAIGAAFATHAASQGHSVGFFSAEMMDSEIYERMLASEARVDGMSLSRGELGKSSFASLLNAFGKMKDWPLWFYDQSGMTIQDVKTEARAIVREKGVDLLVVDYLQLVKPSRKSGNREQDVAEVSNSLKLLAKELEVPIIALAQLNRQSANRSNNRPALAEIRESGAIEQDADIAMLLSSPEREDEAAYHEREIIVDVAKNRHGPNGSVTLTFKKATTTLVQE